MGAILKGVRFFLLVLLVLSATGTAFGAGYGFAHIQGRDRVIRAAADSGGNELVLVQEAWDIIREHFVAKRDLKPKRMVEEAIRGLVKGLDDPHSAFVDAEQYKLERSASRGTYEGIGATVALENNRVVIVAPMPGSPAEQAGIRAGDAILKIDGKSAEGISLIEVVNRIKGPKGTTVTLTILHKGETKPVDVTVVREEIKTPSVALQVRDDKMAHLQLGYFGDRTVGELQDALRKAKEQGAKGLILDLRYNPGGSLDVVVQVASQFLKEGVVAYQEDAEGRREAWPVRSGGLATDIPLVVLVNEASASGAEVAAAALQDAKRAPLIGVKTFGKGSVNQFFELSDGSALYLSVGRWFTPNGRLIEGKGLVPDIEVELSDEDIQTKRDSQLERALDYLKLQ